MIRDFKLGMAVLAVVALAAFGAPAAQAASSLDVGAAPAILEGAQVTTNVFKITNSGGVTVTTVKCTGASLKGTSTTTNVTTQLFKPAYSGCTMGGLMASVIVDEGCEYRLNSTATAQTWSADVACPSGETIAVVQGSCVITIPSQIGRLVVTTADEGSGSTADVLANLNVSGIAVTGGSGCPANLIGSENKGDLTGTQTIKAFRDVSGKKGAQVSLTAT
jgi:hypothetical protein